MTISFENIRIGQSPLLWCTACLFYFRLSHSWDVALSPVFTAYRLKNYVEFHDPVLSGTGYAELSDLNCARYWFDGRCQISRSPSPLCTVFAIHDGDRALLISINNWISRFQPSVLFRRWLVGDSTVIFRHFVLVCRLRQDKTETCRS